MDTTETQNNTPPVPPSTPVPSNAWLMPASVVLAGLFIGGAVIWNGAHPAGAGLAAAAGGTPTAPKADIKNVDTSGEPFIGQADAPVTIAFWADYQCPFCKQFEDTTLPQLIQQYVDTGKAKIVFFDFPFLGADSMTGAEYGRAVWKLYPDKYFAWRTAMYAAQDQEGDQGFGNAASIDKLDATIPGIDAAKIAADVTANRTAYDTAIAKSHAEGEKEGVNATPSFVIGTQMIAGALPFASFQQAIDPLLK